MGYFSNEDVERMYYNDDTRKITRTTSKYDKEYEKFRRKYKSTSPRKPIEPKNWDREPDENEHDER